MPPRSIWSGSISFGLVNVPVKLVTAVRSHSISFNLLHKEDGIRLEQRRVCPAHDEPVEVAWQDTVRGYPLAPDQYVVMDPSELDELIPRSTRLIEIEEFVDLDEIDPIYFEHPYYLAPDARAAKPYRLLVEAMEKSGKVAVGRFVMRTKEYLAALRAKDGRLVISTMRFADEVVDPASIDTPELDEVELTDRELKLAEQLIDSLTNDSFDPTKYRDEYQEQVLEIIERKAEGEEIVVQPTTEEPAKVVDLMAALEASLKGAKGGAAPKKKARRKAS